MRNTRVEAICCYNMDINWKEVFIDNLDWHLTGEIVIRTFIMFAMVLIMLRLSGKKGVRQLSIFEVAIIIALGSAAGDPMFNQDQAILPALIVFATILLFYRFITWLAVKSERFESVLEGDAMYIIEDGEFVLMSASDHTFAKDEFLSEMRQASIEHLGQVRVAILETTGNISFYYYSDEDVKPGMPVLPKVYQKKSKEVGTAGSYACTYCGHVQQLEPGKHCCKRCEQGEWVGAINTCRIS